MPPVFSFDPRPPLAADFGARAGERTCIEREDRRHEHFCLGTAASTNRSRDARGQVISGGTVKRFIAALILLALTPTIAAAQNQTADESWDDRIAATVLPATDAFADAIFYSIDLTLGEGTAILEVPRATGAPVAVDIVAALGNQEPPVSVTITGVPDDMIFSAGENLGAGSWRFETADLTSLTVATGFAAGGPERLAVTAEYGAALPIVLIWLLSAAVILTIYMGFINIRGFGQAIRIVSGD